MHSLEEACKAAIEYLHAPSGSKVKRILDVNTEWAVFLDNEGRRRMAPSSVYVNKETLATRLFRLPSKENFAVLSLARDLEIPIVYSARKK